MNGLVAPGESAWRWHHADYGGLSTTVARWPIYGFGRCCLAESRRLGWTCALTIVC